MIDELPRGWVRTTIGDVADSMKNGLYKPASSYADNGIACLRMYNIDAGKIVWKNIKRMKLAAEEVRQFGLLPGDLLVNRVNSRELVGKAAVIPRDTETCVFESKNIRLRLRRDLVCPELVNYKLLLSGSQHFTHNAQQVVGMASISQPQIAAFELFLPPLAEQRRIVAKLEKLLTQVNACQARLSRIPVLLKRFRQSALAAACSGRLTADWREGNHHIQTATELLRAFPVEQKTTKKRAGRLWGAGEVPQLTDEELEGLPSTWVWTKVGELGYDSADAVQVGPMSMQSRDFTEKGVPVLNVGCVQLNGFDESKLDHMPTEKADSFSRYKIAADDILFTRSGTVGRCALATSRQDGWLMTFHLLRVRPNPGKCLPKYLLFVLQGSSNVLRQTTGAAIGSTRAGFNTRLLAELDVPLPPFGEQQEIVHRIESLFALADRLEARFAEAQKRVNSITQSILAKAFRGELVPTEAELAKSEGRSFESAEELLTRIRRKAHSQKMKQKAEPKLHRT
jgi:type I restriction enzyme S subunit